MTDPIESQPDLASYSRATAGPDGLPAVVAGAAAIRDDDVVPDSVLTPVEVEHEFGISTLTLLRWRDGQTGPRHFRLGGRLVYRRDEISTWIAAHGTVTTER